MENDHDGQLNLWPSFTDLMTTLFFVMLVLYVLTFARLKMQQIETEKSKEATEQQLKTIKDIQAAVKQLPTRYFEYDSTFKRFTLKQQIQFENKKDVISDADAPTLIGVGRSIASLLDTLKANYKEKDISYMIVIEGMASKLRFPDNYGLSYKRALAVYNLWQQHGIHFDPSVAEVQIAGSGERGIGRFNEDGNGGRDSMNQRILIQIIPKIGKID